MTYRSTIVTALAFAAFASTTVEAGPWPVRKHGPDLLIETPHYRIRTDLTEEAGQTVASQQEVLFRELYRRMGKIKPKVGFSRLHVLVYESRERYLSELGEKVRGSRGVFSPGKDVLACWAKADELDIILRTLRHEGTHQFVMHFIGPTCPVWLNEGLAVFYEHAEFTGEGMEVGQVPAGRLAVLRRALAEDKPIPIREMLSMSYEQWGGHVREETPEAQLQYCQAWSMVHFLAYADQTRYRAAFLQYMYYLARDEPARAAWLRTFGADYEGFRKRWQAYVEALEPSSEMTCRRHLEVLGSLLMEAHGKLPMPKTMAAYRKAVLEGRFGKWELRADDGYAIDSEDTERLAPLFVCPNHRDKRADSSYELVPAADGGPPVLRCRHHAGLVLETRYVKDADGAYTECDVVAVPSRRRR